MGAAPFARDGFVVVDGVLTAAECVAIAAHIDVGDVPGSRNMLAAPWCAQLARDVQGVAALALLIPEGHAAVQCTYFEKSQATNWLVPVHQDLSIPVREKVVHPALSGWSLKQGTCFVQPPLDVLQQLVAVRVHLDACGLQDGPLRVVPRSHIQGVIDADRAAAMRGAQGDVPCPAALGAALVMRPLLLHASSKSTGHSRRRVLHFLYAPAQLPYGLAWGDSV